MPEAAKEIAYAYPTSIDATKVGLGKTGAYTVSVSGDAGPKLVAGFATFKEAHAYTESLPQPYGFFSLLPDENGLPAFKPFPGAAHVVSANLPEELTGVFQSPTFTA